MGLGQPAKLSKPQELTSDHDIAGFQCGSDALDDWLKRYALKNHIAGNSRVIVVTNDINEVVGYVAISSGTVTHAEATGAIRRNAPDPIPMGLIGRLATRSDMVGLGIGKGLLREAVLRIVQASKQMGVRGILVHAKDEGAANFYSRWGFRRSPINEKTMMITLREVAAEVSRGSK